MSSTNVMTVVTFADDGDGKTLLTIVQTVPSNAMAAKGQREGWSGSLEKLATALGVA